MLTADYQRYIKSPQWKARREIIMAYYGRWCRGCLKKTGVLQLHHLTYEHLGRETAADCRVLCADCHREVTALHWKMGKRTAGIVVYNTFITQKRLARLKGKRR